MRKLSSTPIGFWAWRARLEPDQAEDFDIAMRQVRRMETTVNHFLSFARPQEPQPSEIQFGRLVDEALVVVQPRANQQEVEIARHIQPALPRVQGDPRQLGEVLVNLFVNALDAMPQGGRLSIRVTPDRLGTWEAARPAVRIDVADTGPGIPEAVRQRLFEPFVTTKASGSGLGLAIAQTTIERHGGTIQVDSLPGRGTTFSILLPANEAPESDHG